MAGSTAPARTAPPERAVATRVIAELLDHYDPVIARLLAGTSTSSATLRAWIANAWRQTPALIQCDPETVLGAALRCAQVNLAPNDGNNLCSIIPYGRNATWQLGYGGVLELARRAAPGLMFDGAAVYPDDEFDVDLAAQTLTHRPAFARFDKSGRRRGRRGEPFAYWVRARYPDGRTHVHAIDRDRVEYHRSFSRQPDGPAWSKSYDAMALKSAVLELRRWLPASPVLAAAVAADGVVVDVRELDEDAPALPAGGPVEPDADEQWVAEASAET